MWLKVLFFFTGCNSSTDVWVCTFSCLFASLLLTLVTLVLIVHHFCKISSDSQRTRKYDRPKALVSDTEVAYYHHELCTVSLLDYFLQFSGWNHIWILPLWTTLCSMGGYRNTSNLHNPCMCVRVKHNMVVSSGIETASGLIDCSFLMIPMHESLKLLLIQISKNSCVILRLGVQFSW